MGEILNIRVSTVKSHVSSVLSKLGVNRRSEDRTAAKKLWLISEDQ
ncbi:DNA-binding response regulator [Butyricicoccus sp. AF22-28AC]|nr:DNA-binding response regulator [Butyricicoccus sp. AF22-28AC]RHR90015.1 DNA-binding response regulator [Butyricicoccus sp. AF15-40]